MWINKIKIKKYRAHLALIVAVSKKILNNNNKSDNDDDDDIRISKSYVENVFVWYDAIVNSGNSFLNAFCQKPCNGLSTLSLHQTARVQKKKHILVVP